MNLLDVFDQTSGFITQWTVAGDATARTITLPLVNTRSEGSLAYNCTVDWGDGSPLSTVTAYNDANRVHTYASNGTYNVEVRGTCEGWSFNNGGDKLKIVKVVYWGDAGGFNGFKYLAFAFYGCTNLTSLGTGTVIPSGTGILTDGFQNFCSTCTSLTSIPVDLFRYNTAVTTSGFTQAFYNCPLLAAVPTDLFRYNTTVSSFGFNQTFAYCSSLTTLPADIFRYNTAVSSSGFNRTFLNCTGLATLPADLFRYNTAVVTFGFMHTFDGCTALQVPADVFFRPGEETTRFLNKSVDFTSCFTRTSFSGVQGTAPDLWNCSFGTGTPLTTGCFGGAGNSLTSLSNYASIPGAWE